MRVNKAMVLLNMARSMGEATRLMRQGAVLVGGCISPCNPRWCCPEVHGRNVSCPVPLPNQFRCTCKNWKKSTDFKEEVDAGKVIRIGDGNLRLLPREDGKQGFDQLEGIGRVPEEVVDNLSI